MKRLLIALAALVAAVPAYGQAILQGGAWTAGHAPMYVGGSNSQPIVQDSGPAAGGAIGLGLAEQLLTVRSATNSYPAANGGTGPLSTNWCNYDGPTTGAYHYLCMSPNAQGGGLIAFGFGGGATSLPFNFNINGTNYTFPFTTTGVIGPGTSVVNDVACWNNLVGTLLKDCGGLVSLSANNTWTGTNNFTSTFQIGGTTETFPASGNIVGTSDIQTLTNKSISAGQINSGTLGAAEMPALTGDVTSSAGTVATTIASNAVTNAKLATATQNTIKGAATSTAEADLTMPSCSGAGNALQWVTNTGIQCGTLTGQSAGWGLNLSASTFSVSTSAPPFGFDVPINMSLSASAGASALTINLLAADTGSAPAAGHPVLIPFRSTTLATGTTTWTAVTSSLSIVVPSGATLGTTNSVPFRLWIFAEYNSGTPELGVATCSSTTTIYPCAAWENTRITTTTISGLSTSLGTLYSTTGVSNDAVRIIGFCDFSSGLATVGSWASACTTLQPMGPGIKKPGDIVQIVTASTTTAGTATTATYAALASGTTIAITPTASMNLIKVEADGSLLDSSASTSIARLQLSRGVVANTGIFGTTAVNNTVSGVCPARVSGYDAPGTTSSTTYAVQGKVSSASGSISFPNSGDTATFTATEIMG
jgi:hypothetical protein